MSTDETTPWWEEGDEDEIIDEEKAKADTPYLRRFYLPAEKANELTFVTDVPFLYREHNLKLDGHWRNWFTCTKKGCGLCRTGNSNYFAAAYLVIDHSEWEDSDGNEHRDELRLFVCKTRTAAQLKRIREKKGRLRGLRIEAFRSSKKVPNVGDQFTVEKEYKDSELKRLEWWPKDEDVLYNGADRKKAWAQLLAPKTADELANILSKVADDHEEEDEDAAIRF